MESNQRDIQFLQKELIKGMSVDTLRERLKFFMYGKKKFSAKSSDYLLDVCLRELKSGQTPEQNKKFRSNQNLPLTKCPQEFNKNITETYTEYPNIVDIPLCGYRCKVCRSTSKAHRISLPTNTNTTKYCVYCCFECFFELEDVYSELIHDVFRMQLNVYKLIKKMDVDNDVMKIISRLTIF
jgi:hypothetical protein